MNSSYGKLCQKEITEKFKITTEKNFIERENDD